MLRTKTRGWSSVIGHFFIIALLVVINAGCSVGMAISGSENKDTSILFIGAPRDGVLAKLGPPETSDVNAAGERMDTYLITKGNKPSTDRAAAHAGLSVFTYGLWEIIGTPMEMEVGRESTSRYIITYGPDNKIKDVKAVDDAKKLKEM